MNRRGIRILTCAIGGTLLLSGFDLSLHARNNQRKLLPAAGIAVVLEEGMTIDNLNEEVVQNIAYLESVSGIQPNIVIASEKVALADGIDTEQSETGSEETSEESGEASTEASTENSTEDDGDDIRLSAGFSAVDNYQSTEAEETTEEDSTEMEETTEEATEEETLIEEETETEEQDFSGLVIAQVNNYVNVRDMPSEEGEIVGKLYDKSVGTFIEEEDGWYKINSGNCTGYVKAEYCVTGEEAEALAKEVGTTYAVVNTTTLKVREEAGTDSIVLGLVPIEEELVVVEELDGWVKVAIEEGDGYVSRDYVTLRTDFVQAESKEEEEARIAKEQEEAAKALAAAEEAQARQAAASAEKSQKNQAAAEAAVAVAQSSAGSEMGKAVVDYACQFVGNPYVYGGTSLTNGADCSGFVMSVYQNFGVSLPHSSSALRSRGYDVGGISNAQPGDIVCYSGHVAIYIGNGQIVHASTSKTGIIISSNVNYRNVLSVRRIF